MNSWKQIAAAQAVLSRETGAIYKDHGGKLTVALAYPNSYYVGMSSLALQILYRAFNDRPDVACERVFWDAGLAAAGRPLLSLESQTPVDQFAVWAFTISFEMDYFNVIAMLRQAGVPLLAEERTTDSPWPLLIAGGPAVSMNPEPMAPFFDAIVIGEAEEILPRLIDILRDGLVSDSPDAGRDREAVLDALDALPGVYVPTRVAPAPNSRRIERLWVRDMTVLRPVSALYTPDTEFANRHLIEIARGCGRGCRFCLAGYVYRPPREQPAERILAWARESMAGIGADGFRPDGIGLVSAAVSDHSQIDELATGLQAMGARISISSMRTDPISVPMVRALATSGAQTLTIAPEAGTERLRRVINKTQTEDDLLAAVELAQALGFPQLKLYFMVGHPTETDDDVQGIIDLTLKARATFRRNIAINATPFVPKAHTPFQWAAMTPARTLKARQKTLQRGLARHGVAVSADSPEWAEVQAVLARGDRRLASVLASLAQPSPRSFRAALAEQGLSVEEYLGDRTTGAFMPWDIVESGVKASFLRHEQRLADDERPGHRCPPDTLDCLACGVCRAGKDDRRWTMVDGR